MEKLQNNGSKSCDMQRKSSSRFCIKSQPKIKKVFEQVNCNREPETEVKKVSDQEDPKVIENREIDEEMKKTRVSDEEEPKNLRLDEAKETKKKEKKKMKRGFTLALSKEEIEEDILELMGSNPSISRRPTKRSKASQNRLRNFLPGIWMESLID
ncbi:hypothetical protein M9H77_27650 [Catharanthus roseus]|uniref:Uncharacterized protein n=1 Tax=Catharanthus roseus TaxID=4058 RepID=A0ACC0AD39_CATRO|nr:hypothetical protein M9H77_27650 [Catharanthus roseus]